MAQNLDLSAAQVVIDRAFRSRAYDTLHEHAKLVAQSLGPGKVVGTIRVADHLHIPFTITHIDKDDATVIAPAVDPAAEAHSLAQQGLGHQTTVVGTHRHTQLSEIRGQRRTVKHNNYFGRGLDAAAPGATDPIEITYVKASSTLIASSTTSARGSSKKKPLVGLGVVGT